MQITTPSKVFQSRVMLLDMTADAPAKSQWMSIKQFNGYSGCPCCEEEGEQFVIGEGRKKRKRTCHIYPFNEKNAQTTGHGTLRDSESMKRQAVTAIERKSQGVRQVFAFKYAA